MENQIRTFYRFGDLSGVAYICFDEANIFQN